MAVGGWLAGVIGDAPGCYAPALIASVGFNMLNQLLIGMLVPRTRCRA